MGWPDDSGEGSLMARTRRKRPRDPMELAKLIGDIATPGKLTHYPHPVPSVARNTETRTYSGGIAA